MSLQTPETTEWCVITGAPSSGKTTLINALAQRSFRVQHDVARSIIQAQLLRGASKFDVRREEEHHRKSVVARMIADAQLLPRNELIFFDYAIPDNIAFTVCAGLPVDKSLWQAANAFRFRQIFLLSALPLDSADSVRIEDKEAQQRLDTLIRHIYVQLNYKPVEIPVAPVEERLRLVLSYTSNPTN